MPGGPSRQRTVCGAVLRPSRRGFLGLVGGAAVGAACRPSGPVAVPEGRAPSPSEVARAVGARAEAVQVPRARIRFGAHRGRLAYLAQRPARFRGTVTVAGQDVLTLAFSEAGYQLVDKLSDRPGYVEGADPSCAVARLSGVALAPEAFVAVVCGGVPVPPGTRFEPGAYDPEAAAHTARAQVAGGVVVVWLRPVAPTAEAPWVPVRARLPVAGVRGAAEVLFAGWDRAGGAWFPRRWTVRAPGERRRLVVEVVDLDLAPAWAAEADGRPSRPTGRRSAAAGRDGGTAADPGDGWDEGGAWENADAGGAWENADAAAAPPASEPPRGEPKGPEAPPVPARFRLAPPAGLPRLPDPCRR